MPLAFFVWLSGRTLKDVHPQVKRKFMSAAENLYEEDGVGALAAALATIAGHTGKQKNGGQEVSSRTRRDEMR